MRKFLFILCLIPALALCFSCNAINKTPEDKPLVILYDNDVHCGNDADGYAQAAGLRDAINSSGMAYCILVSSGDYLQGGIIGSKSKGADMVTILNKVRYDAMTIGNHELDFGMERLLELLGGMKSPVTCVNLCENDSRRPLLDPYVMINLGARKIAAIGVLTPEAMTAEKLSFYDKDGKLVYDLNSKQIPSLVQDAADKARRKGADYVIVLSHLGENYGEMNSRKLIAATSGIDAVLDGHSHSVIQSETLLNKDGKPVLLTQTGTKFQNLGELRIETDGSISNKLTAICDIPFCNNAVKSVVDSIKAVNDKELSRIIGKSEVTLTINDKDGKRAVRKKETNLGDMATDAIRLVCGAQIGVLNGGAIRTDIPAGDVSLKKILEVLPFGYNPQLVTATGKEIAAMLDFLSEGVEKGLEAGGFPQVSGIRFKLHLDMPYRVSTGDVEVLDESGSNYEPLDPDKEYTLALTDYCYAVLSDILTQGRILKQGFGTDAEVVAKYVSENLHGLIGKEYDCPQGRIVMVPDK